MPPLGRPINAIRQAVPGVGVRRQSQNSRRSQPQGARIIRVLGMGQGGEAIDPKG